VIAAHVAAVKALLTGQGLTVSVGFPVDVNGVPIVLPSRPYVVLLHNDGVAADRTLEAISATRGFEFQTTTVGDSDVACQQINDKVFAALLDVVPTVSGRSCWPIEHTASDQTRPDMDETPPVFVGANRWALRSTPA
jgi:hypothetical protein